MIDAFSKLQAKNSKLTIIGNGPLLTHLKEKSCSLGIENRVQFYIDADRTELMQRISDCDIFVLPSVERSEAFGIVQLEAMAFGKPVINTSLQSGVPYVSIDGETGLTVPPNDVNALTSAIQTFIGS